MRTRRLRTERLELRRFEEDDAEACFKSWMSDPEVTHFATWSPHRDVLQTRRIIGSWVRQYEAGSMDWCITLRSTGEPIGSITAVRDHPDQRYCEIGYCLAQRYWDNGYMTEAVTAVSRYTWTPRTTSSSRPGTTPRTRRPAGSSRNATTRRHASGSFPIRRRRGSAPTGS